MHINNQEMIPQNDEKLVLLSCSFFFCVYAQLYLDLARKPTIEELAVSLEVTSEQIKGYEQIKAWY